MKKELQEIIENGRKVNITALIKKMHEEEISKNLQDDETIKHINPGELLYDASGHMGKTVSIAKHFAHIFNYEFFHELAHQQNKINNIHNGEKSLFKVLFTDEVDKYHDSCCTEFRGNHCTEISEHTLDVGSLIKHLMIKNTKSLDKTIIRLSEKPWLFQDLI